MKTSDSDPKVNRNIYPDAVTCDRMSLIGPKNAPKHIQTTIFGSLGKQDRLFIKVFWYLFTSRLKTQSCVDKKKFVFSLGLFK